MSFTSIRFTQFLQKISLPFKEINKTLEHLVNDLLISVNNINGIEEVNMIKDGGCVIHFNNPKVQASLAANTFAVTGHAENKRKHKILI